MNPTILLRRGEEGELCLGGKQLSPGYWDNPKKTAEVYFQKSFPHLSHTRWYRTGDQVKLNSNGDLEYIGRIDNQVKILGYRVELGEVERVVRSILETELVVAVAWPRDGATAGGIAVFVSGGNEDWKLVVEKCKKELPPYMVPRLIRDIDRLPLNANGKIDRRALEVLLNEEKCHG